MMIQAYPQAYDIADDDLEVPDAASLKAVLGKSHDTVAGQYNDDQLKLFDPYHRKFKLGSKPTWHIRALSNLSDDDLLGEIPEVMERLLDRVTAELSGLFE